MLNYFLYDQIGLVKGKYKVQKLLKMELLLPEQDNHLLNNGSQTLLGLRLTII